MVDDSALSGQAVLVTGASGFIGSRLCERLAIAGAVVHGVSRKQRDDDLVDRWWRAEMDDESACRQLVDSVQPDTIFDLASLVTGRREIEYVAPTLRGNLLSTVNLLTSATDCGVRRLVLTGSLEEPVGDASVATPASPYAAAKGASNMYSRMFHALYATPVVSARLFMVYGPGQRDLNKLIPYVILSSRRGEAPQLMSGTREVDWIYVDDVVDAYLALATGDGLFGHTLDIGSGELTSVRRIVELLMDAMGAAVTPSFGSVNDRPMERIRVADVDQTSALTGWRPKTHLVDGLRQTVEWYLKHGPLQ